MPTFDVSLPKIKGPEGQIDIEGPDIKGGQFNMPSIDISLPKGKIDGDVDVDAKVKGGKFKMPTFDVSLPKFKGPEIDIEGPDVKGGKLNMPSIDMSLPKGNVEGDIDLDAKAKGGKFKMPTFDVSFPKCKGPEGQIDIEGPDVNGGKFNMPSIDISLPKGNVEGNIDVDAKGKGGKFKMPTFDVSIPKGSVQGDVGVNVDAEGKGGKFKMPSFDVSLPKPKTPENKVDIEGPDIKGGKISMPSIDISLPKGHVKGDVDVKAKGGKFKMPKIGISLPKMKRPGSGINIEGPEFEGGKISMPTIDISLPKGSVERDAAMEGKVQSGKINMPTFDASLPKLKSAEGKLDVEVPELKGGKFDMPSIDISLPKGKVEGDVDVDGKAKGGKFKMPTFDVSLPKFKGPEGQIDIEGPDVKGGKLNMPSIDISLPKGSVEGDIDMDAKAKGGKFKMTTFDVSLPKLKGPEGQIDIEGPNVKGGKFKMPSIDISLPKGNVEGDIDLAAEGKGGSIKMPIFDVSLPKFKSPEGNIDVESPEVKGGKFHMPTIDISLPKGSVAGDVDVDGKMKDGKFKMPTFDISLPKGNIEGNVDIDGHGQKIKMPSIDFSLPKMKMPEGEVKVEGTDIKGGKFNIPSIDISLPKGKAKGDVDLDEDKKGEMFKMPTLDISLPKTSITSGSATLEGPEIKKGTGKVPSVDIALPSGEAKLGVDGSSEGNTSSTIKLPNVKIPTVNISAPKVDLDFGLTKSKDNDREDIELLKAEGGRPSSGASFDVPDVTLKMPKFSLPKFGGKSKSGGIELEGHGSTPYLEAESSSPSAEVDHDIKAKGKIKKHKIKMPFFGTSKKDVEINVTGPGWKKEKEADIKMPSLEISLPATKTPEHEVLLPKTEVDVSEADIRGYEGALKIPKMPTIDISVPKVDVDVALPKLKHDVSADSGTHVNIEGEGGKMKIPNIKMPTIDISLPKGKSGDIKTPELELDGEGGKFKWPHIQMPTVDISLSKGKSVDVNVPEVEVKGDGGKFKMPSVKMPVVDISLPKGQTGNINAPEVEVKGEGGKFKMPNITMPALDMSLPKGKSGQIEANLEVEGEGGKVKMPDIKMPKVDVSLPKGKSADIKIPDVELGVKGGKCKMADVKMPTVDVSLPSANLKGSGKPELHIRGEGGTTTDPKLKMPQISVSLPHVRTGDNETCQLRGEGEGKFTMPSVEVPTLPRADLDVILGKQKQGEPSGNVDADVSKDGEHKGLKIKIPTIDIEAPKGDLELNIGLRKGEGKKDRKKIEFPDIHLNPLVSEGKVKGPKVKGTKFKIGMPKMKNTSSEIDVKPEKDNEGVSGRFKVKKTKMGKDSAPEVTVSVPTEPTIATIGSDHDIKTPKIPEIDFDIGTSSGYSEADRDKGGKVKVPKFGVALPSISSYEGGNISGKLADVKGFSVPDPEIDYEGPKMPKVTKAVFVLVNPQADSSNVSGEEEGVHVKENQNKMPEIKVKAGLGKSGSKGRGGAECGEEEVEVDGKSKTGKLKMPKVVLSPGKSGSFDVTSKTSDSGREEVAGLNGEKDGSKFVKLKMPKLEFTSPYSKNLSEEEHLEMSTKLVMKESDKEGKGAKSKSGKIAFPGFKKKIEKEEVETESTLVFSTARTEMLAERESSESPSPQGFVSFLQRQHESSTGYSTEQVYEREGSTWYEVPRVTLSPHSAGLLQMTPEGSPCGSRSSPLLSSDEASGDFHIQMPRLQMASQGEHKEEYIVTTTTTTREMSHDSRASPHHFGGEALGGFPLHMPQMQFTTQGRLKEELIVTTTKEETVTVVTSRSKSPKQTLAEPTGESSIEKGSSSQIPRDF
ncbi:hypothetical protein AALO_G00205430 [Alosa alosa]|uniref:AHNAK nucleoprotein n=2 Tax=Alosa alosa TaxID=278164 RepID=A0AAV6G3V7_9TELE|nr:hypothetical protein AALO_G00205430 [Alosa alosa]